jgi:hypothetical protein
LRLDEALKERSILMVELEHLVTCAKDLDARRVELRQVDPAVHQRARAIMSRAIPAASPRPTTVQEIEQLAERVGARAQQLLDLSALADEVEEIPGRSTELPALDVEYRRVAAFIEEKLERVETIDRGIEAFHEWWLEKPRTPYEEMMARARKTGERRRRNYPHMYRVTH